MKKILHLSFHNGCQNDMEYISKKLGFELHFMKFTDGITQGNDIYNVTHQRAKDAWDKYKDYYQTLDVCVNTP